MGGIREVVLDRVGGPEDFRLFATNDGMDHFDLNFKGEAGREPVDVDFIGGDPLWFQEDLMFWFVGEPDEFVFNARTITGSDALNDSGIHRGLVQILQDDLPGAIGGMGDVAGFLTAMPC